MFKTTHLCLRANHCTASFTLFLWILCLKCGFQVFAPWSVGVGLGLRRPSVSLGLKSFPSLERCVSDGCKEKESVMRILGGLYRRLPLGKTSFLWSIFHHCPVLFSFQIHFVVVQQAVLHSPACSCLNFNYCFQSAVKIKGNAYYKHCLLFINVLITGRGVYSCDVLVCHAGWGCLGSFLVKTMGQISSWGNLCFHGVRHTHPC